ncbi:1-acyl-sn-glycerol-3-phosphate acyltransferase [Antricoccus suffuscus]|uniref:1-acyl-sn-glycerol-3-phosphate acyltransferase n=1 Tax=Antricoccus suffuscus TaxID=1629062 RepID=A0A2T1A568_9ACTN|nr:lysophospholipid acyltransferase family protein [Antricoccus suffuscus]PRZ43488.1 1-acyl-sn-glycerol-3-phosphate acyltransferase [Antricoccus suffuscus]
MSTSADKKPKRKRPGGRELSLTLRFVAPLVRNASRLLFKEKFRNRELIPATGPALLVLNHVSVVDPLAVASYVWSAGRLPRFMIKDGVFKAPVVGAAMRHCKQIEVARGSANALKSIDDAVSILQEGGVVVVYPEGTVTRNDSFWPMRSKTGVARIARAAPDAPVITLSQWGAQDTWNYHTRKKSIFPRKKVTIVAHGELDLTAERALPNSESYRRMTDRMMNDIAAGVGELRGETPPPDLFADGKSDAS